MHEAASPSPAGLTAYRTLLIAALSVLLASFLPPKLLAHSTSVLGMSNFCRAVINI
jgi:hypothetical protein